jgi:hypothetical protein
MLAQLHATKLRRLIAKLASKNLSRATTPSAN